MALTDFNVYLETNYGLDYTLGASRIRDVFPGATDADKVDAAGAVFPWFLAYCSCDSSRFGVGAPDRVPTPGAPQWTDTQMADLSYATASHNDAILATGGAIGQDWYFGALPLSRANIIWPHGSYYVNYPCWLNFGQYIGQGSSNYAPDINSPLSQVCGGTRISIWHEEWLDIPAADDGPIKHIFESINWPRSVGGTLYAGILGATGASATSILDAYYMEGCQVGHFRFEGRKDAAPEAVGGGNTYVTTYEDAGIAIWRMGSGSKIYDCNGYSFNNAVYTLASGVPSNCYNLHGFDCNLAAAWLRGDGTFGFDGFECDECPTVFLASAFVNPASPSSNLLTPGATLKAENIKIETGTSGVSSRYKGTMLFDGEGWCVATFDSIGYASANIYPEILIRIRPYPTGFTSTNSTVSVTGLKIFGFVRTLLHHAVSSGQAKKWLVPGGMYTVKYDTPVNGFYYDSANGGQFTFMNGENATQLDVPYTNLQNFLTLPLSGATWTDTVNPGLPTRVNPPSP